MKRLLLLVGAIVLVDTMFYAALTPLLPHYARELGLSKAGAGVLAGAYAIGALLGGIPSGLLASRFGVKPTILLGTDSPLGPKPKLTREHVLPQSPDWDTPDWDQFTPQDHAQYVERLGNTLLLTGVTNRELKNKSWAEKKQIILSKGVKQLPLTEEALKEMDWTKQTIEMRQEKMAKPALEVWPE